MKQWWMKNGPAVFRGVGIALIAFHAWNLPVINFGLVLLGALFCTAQESKA